VFDFQVQERVVCCAVKAVGGIFTTTGGERHEFADCGTWLRRVDGGWNWHVKGDDIFLYADGVRQTGWFYLPHARVYLRPTHNGAKAVGGTFTTANGERHEFGGGGEWIRRVH